ncbi:hypothetical protein EDC01DRAFT_636819 [Geopyxis carbonaria]|nr:hypothetical protein EDC01DRAFT_636819 [Geopyxis carbonaria]
MTNTKTADRFRREHKKSRNGCCQCKLRHKKVPLLLVTQRRCVYFAAQKPPAPSTTVSAASDPPEASKSPAASATIAASTPAALPNVDAAPELGPAGLAAPAPQLPGSVNMRHMELLNHFLLETCHSLQNGFHNPASLKFIMASALGAPYLMNEILAIAALHLARLHPAQKPLYRGEAAVLQTQAINCFNAAVQADAGPAQCVPMFLFSSLLGIHVLADAVGGPDNSNDSFLDKFIVYLNVHRGVRTITNRSWEYLRQSDLEPLIRPAVETMDLAQAHVPDAAAVPECTELWRLLEAAGEIKETCHDAVQNLQQVFDSEHHKKSAQGVVFAWPVLVSEGFTDLLLKRRPEALIILAHYAVLLHARRDVWVVGEAGRMLIESITAHLGTYWKHWLAWPNSVLRADK